MLQVPKTAVAIELLEPHGTVERAMMFLADDGPRRERLQNVLAARRFVPVRQGERVAFVRCAGLMWVRLELMDAIDELSPETEDAANSQTVAVDVVLEDGARLSGAVRYLLPPESRRLGDYLDTMAPFFPLRTPDHVYLVNRDRCVRVEMRSIS